MCVWGWRNNAEIVNLLMGRHTLKPQTNGSLHSRTVIDTLAVDGWAVTFGTGLKGPGRAAAPPSSLLAVPNVTVHPSTTSVPTSYIRCGIIITFAVKGYSIGRVSKQMINYPRSTFTHDFPYFR